MIKNLIQLCSSRQRVVVPDNCPIDGTVDILIQTLNYEFTNVLDIGLGKGGGSLFFLLNGKETTAIGYDVDTYDVNKYVKQKTNIYKNINIEEMKIFKDRMFDAVWCSHVLEHCQNIGLALSEIKRVLHADGTLFLSVPPYKKNVVGGHINVGWNVGLLMYVLCINGFDVANGSFVQHGYNITAFVKSCNKKLPRLRYDDGDIETLVAAGFLPEFFFQGIDGDLIKNYNWIWVNREKYRIVAFDGQEHFT